MNLKHLKLNYLIQFLLSTIAIIYHKTLNNMFMAFLLAQTGYLAALLQKFMIYIYIILQFIIYFLFKKYKQKKMNIIFTIVILSTPLLGWISVFNAFAWVWLTRKK